MKTLLTIVCGNFQVVNKLFFIINQRQRGFSKQLYCCSLRVDCEVLSLPPLNLSRFFTLLQAQHFEFKHNTNMKCALRYYTKTFGLPNRLDLILFFKRFIEDILLFLTGTVEEFNKFLAKINTSHPTIKFTAYFETKSTTFLDTVISIVNGEIHIGKKLTKFNMLAKRPESFK